MIVAAGLFSSCGDVLEIYPVSNNSADSFFANDREITQGLMGIYARLGRDGGGTDFPSLHYLQLSESRSDNWFIGQPANAQRDQMDVRNYQATSMTGIVASSFNRLYSLIASANMFLSKLPEDAKYTRMAAEARFLRAYAHFELVRTWGPVPVITVPIEKADTPGYRRDPVDKVYAQIIEDLDYAITNLGATYYTGAESGRVGSWAARTMLAYVYVTMAGYPLNDTSAYSKAVDVLKGSGTVDIIDEMNVRFAPTYPQIFSLAEENTWDLFSVQFQSGNIGLGSSVVAYSFGGGGSQSTPFPEWMYANFVQQGQDFLVDTTYVRPMVKAGDARGMDPVLIEYYWNIKTPPAEPSPQQELENHIHKPFILTKYLVRDNTNSMIMAYNDYPLNFPILRVSDAYLLYAEALVGTNKAGEAKKYVDFVRTRAGIPALAADPTMADIFDERRKEFIGEGKRYFDLVRQGEAVFVNTLKAFSDEYQHVSLYDASNPSVRDMLLPIPEPVMKIHTDWEQNP
jgi:hypothetical protein